MALARQTGATGMAERQDDDSDLYYTRRELQDMLYLYPYLTQRKPPRDDVLAEIKWHNYFGDDGWQQKAARKRSEIYRGIMWLNGRHAGICYAVRASYIVGLPCTAIADYFQRIEHRAIHPDTVNEWRKKGFDWMLEYLNGERT